MNKFPPKKTRDESITEVWRDNKNSIDLVIIYYDNTKSISSFYCDCEDGYDYPKINTIQDLIEFGWTKIKETKREEIWHYDTGIPGTLYDLMDELISMVPQIADRHNEIKAKIKGFVHEEKHDTYNRFNLYFKDIIKEHRYLEDFIRDKLSTHGPEGWLNYDKCLDWVNEYGSNK